MRCSPAFVWVVLSAVAWFGAGCGASSGRAQTAASAPLDNGASADGSAASSPELAGPASAEVTAGLKAFDAGQFAEARSSFEAATKKNPKDWSAFVDLGQTCDKLGDKAAEEQAYRSALALRPDLEDAAAELSAVYAGDGKVDEALSVAKGGLAKHPSSAPLHGSLAIALATRGDEEGATKEFEQAVRLSPSDPMLHYTYAAWLNAWKARGAALQLDAALKLIKPDDMGMLAAIGHEYRMAGEFESCVQTFDRAVAVKDGGEVRTERALCKLGRKDEKGTLEDLQAAVTQEPSYAPAHYYLGGRLAMSRRYREAAAQYAKYLSLDPHGSMAEAAGQRMKMAQDAAAHGRGVAPTRRH